MATEIQAPLTRKGRSGPRTGGFRSRTGCATCRIRHVKCDEEKPACRECRRTGRVCDGYCNQGTKGTVDVPSMLYGKIYGVPSAAIAAFHFDFLKTGEERRYYEYFQCDTGQQINSAFGSSTRVHQLILQGSHSNTSIQHTVIALGSLGEHLKEVKTLSQDLYQGKKRLEFADAQYVKGISELQKDMTAVRKPPAEMVLTSCLLLSLFNFLRGEEADGQIHLAAGIDILQHCFAPELRLLTTGASSKHHQPNLLVEDFARIFSVMDLHGSIWVGRPSFHSLPMVHHEIYILPPFKPGTSPSLDDISSYLNDQVVRVHCFHHAHAPSYSPSETSHIPFHVLAEKERLLYNLHQWPALLAQHLSTIPSLTEDQTYRIALLQMNYHSLHVTVSSFFLPPSPSLSHSFQPHLSQIIAHANLILEPNTPSSSSDHPNRVLRAAAANCLEPNPHQLPIFAFVYGAIQPLYLAATRCAGRQMRKEALALLEERPWREGGWDSMSMARLARREVEGRGW